jgi:acetate kinase
VRKYIGAYMAALSGRVDALVFSAGIGENSALVRGLVCQGLQVGAGRLRVAAGP